MCYNGLSLVKVQDKTKIRINTWLMRIFLLLLINFYLTCFEQRLHLSNDQGNLALHSVCTLFDLRRTKAASQQ